jgi:hypothetical protein
MEAKMAKSVRIYGIILLILFGPVTVRGETDIDRMKQQARSAWITAAVYGEYVEAFFKYGRRTETMYRIWANKDTLTRRIVSPLWQSGETSIVTRQNYVYYIPDQKSGLKLTIANHPEYQNRWREWDGWLDKLERLEGITAFHGREVRVCSGPLPNGELKLFLDPHTFFPLGVEVYRKGIKIREIVCRKLDLLDLRLTPLPSVPENIRWYHDREQFWQAVSLPRVQAGVNFSIVQPKYLPAGYVFKKADIRELASATVVHLVYEDSKKQVISLFEREKISERQQLDLEKLKKSRRSGSVLYACQWFENRVHLALIGSISPEEMRKVRASTR